MPGKPAYERRSNERAERPALKSDEEVEVEPAEENAWRYVGEEKSWRPEYPHDETQRNDQPQQQAAGHQQDDCHDRFERLPTCLKRELGSPVGSQRSFSPWWMPHEEIVGETSPKRFSGEWLDG